MEGNVLDNDRFGSRAILSILPRAWYSPAVIYSSRGSANLEPNDFFRAVERRRARRLPLLDLTVSNPTLAGFRYPSEEIRAALDAAAAQPYEPDPKGLFAARQAVSDYYSERGAVVPPESIVLSSGTSEAYGFLFKLLCNPGDAILFPKPGYPLVELIAKLEGVAANAYPLAGRNWRWEISALFDALTPGTRAAVTVSPNNPTGGMLTGKELSALSGFCASHGLALIVDEVFLDYPSPRRKGNVVSAAGNPDALTFTLGGLSKSCGLPQMKLAWIAVSGPEGETRNALERLEFIADAFLTVGTPVQQAAPSLLKPGISVREQIRARVDQNEATLKEILGGIPGVTLFPRDGGWYAVVGLPSGIEDEDFATELLNSQGVVVQPGYFFDFEDAQTVVVSLLTPGDLFRKGAEKMEATLRESKR